MRRALLQLVEQLIDTGKCGQAANYLSIKQHLRDYTIRHIYRIVATSLQTTTMATKVGIDDKYKF